MTTTASIKTEIEAATHLLIAAGFTTDQAARIIGDSEAEGVRLLALFAECGPSADVLVRFRTVFEGLVA